MERDLRRDILAFSHRWPVTILAFLVGAAMGWFVAQLVPSPYRAEAGLYVAYNADAIFRNPDDYKNWQLGQLEAYVISDEVLQATLDRLAADDPYWQAIEPADLQSAIKTYWRNAGKWRLTADWPDAARAAQLATAWRDTVLEKVGAARVLAASLNDLYAQNNVAASQEAQINLRLAVLDKTQQTVAAWRQAASNRPAGQPLEVLERWKLLYLAAQMASLQPLDQSLLAETPPPEASLQTYLAWTAQLQVGAAELAAGARAQVEQLTAQRQGLAQEIEQVLLNSHGFTADLVLEPLNPRNPPYQTRPASQMALVGAILGVLAWVLVWLGRAAPRGNR